MYMRFICPDCRCGIDFIGRLTLLMFPSYREARFARPNVRKERSVDNIDAFSRAPLHARDAVPKSDREIGRQYSPGDFFRQFGKVIAICLGLALVARVLVALSGSY